MTPGPAVVLRPVRPSDEAAVGRVAYQTGFFGDSAARYFRDAALFAALWVGPYFRGGGFGGFVAQQGPEVVGYVLGSPSPLLYRRAVLRVVAQQAWQLRALRTGWPYLWRAARWPGPHADSGRFPAHLHLNLLPQARGQGAGEGLLRAHLQVLAGAGVPGVQLATTTENAAALRLYARLGFTEAARQVTPLWTPWLSHPAEHLCLTKALNPAEP
ncbi:GNAT family N-acetyltransferase [Deinococcus sp. HMF7604]|uniref:GNAT family N-acetyltransferase n=1 Tax=Deinococcus betulae TaxID=2873312 RepID=UPI001CCDA5C3|nr:GNAT family N-acetyltransferase [Deinococcus betulae]MBZ9753269.1 GNAT family N-acetyltransferase [Deinococcus betulae]